jgi:hypothetical protein
MLLALACPSCALGQGRDGADGVVLVAALVLLPLAISILAGLVIGRAVRRHRPE